MFEVYCPTHQSRVLLSSSCIEALHNTPDGIVLEWRCWCGDRGTRAADGSCRSTRLSQAS